jgi:hypothetical protein
VSWKQFKYLPRPEIALMSSLWGARRRAFLALALLLAAGAATTHLLGYSLRQSEVARTLAYMAFALSLFCIFAVSNFTEADRRERFFGFPSRLFTLPASTFFLIAWPMLAAIGGLLCAYLGWARLVFPALGIVLPIGWPCIYLASGMAVFLAVVWSLSGFRVLRLIILGIGGTIFPIAWTAFTEQAADSWMAAYLPGRSLAWIRSALFLTLGGLAFGVAWISVERQRRGARFTWNFWQKAADAVVAVVSPRPVRFKSASHALRWNEWRRQGCILPFCVGVILLLVVLVSALNAPLGPESTVKTLLLVLFAPFALAWVIGKGFGKIDLWSKEPDFPPYFAIRPVANGDWVAVKLRVAARSAAVTWLLLATVTPIWLWQWCDAQPVLQFWTLVTQPSLPANTTTLILLWITAMLLTWRLLTGSLFVGLSGLRLLLGSAICFVFLDGFAALFTAIWISQNPAFMQHLPTIQRWLPWTVSALFAAKMLVAAILANRAAQARFITDRSIRLYSLLWLGGTASILSLVWFLPTLSGGFKYSLALLVLFAMPTLRLSMAPFALALNRHRRLQRGPRSCYQPMVGASSPALNVPTRVWVWLFAVGLSAVAFQFAASASRAPWVNSHASGPGSPRERAVGMVRSP